MQTSTITPWRRIVRFIGGLFAGVLLGGLLGFTVLFVVQDAIAGDVTLYSSGRDMSRSHGTRLLIERQSGRIEQVCNGECDDLSLVNNSRSNTPRAVRVLDAHGRCVACRTNRSFVRTGRVERWDIAGARRLQIFRRTTRAEASR
jgi:hypothetical protein